MSSVLPREDKTPIGILLMALAVFFFICIDSSAKWLAFAGFPIAQIVFARAAGHLVYAVIYFVPKDGVGVFRSNAPKRQFLRSSCLVASTFLNFLALKYLPITVTTTIQFAQPVLITLLAMIFLGERVGIRRFAAIVVGFFGVVVVIQPWGVEFHPAMFLSLLVLICASVYFMLTRMVAGIEHNATQQIWSSAFPALVAMPFAFNVWVWPETWTEIVILLVIGFFGAKGHILATWASRLANASTIAPLIYTPIFYATLAGVLLFDTWPTFWTAIGGAIIIGSGLYIWQRERILAQRNS